MERFARPGSESSPGAQHGVQAKDDLSGESLHREQPGFYRVSCIARSCGYPSKSGTLMGEEEQRSDRAFMLCMEAKDKQLAPTRSWRTHESGSGVQPIALGMYLTLVCSVFKVH